MIEKLAQRNIFLTIYCGVSYITPYSIWSGGFLEYSSLTGGPLGHSQFNCFKKTMTKFDSAGKAYKRTKFNPVQKRSKTAVPSSNFAKKVLRVVHPELKEFMSNTGSAPVAGGFTGCLNQIAAGTDSNQRTGRHIKPISFQYNFDFVAPTTGAATSDYITMWIVWDKQPDGAPAGFSTIFDTVPGARPDLTLLNTALYRDRFVLLRRHTCYLASGATGQNQSDNIVGSGFIRLSQFDQCEFNSSAGATPNTGALLLCCRSQADSGSAASSAQFNINAKFQYNDM